MINEGRVAVITGGSRGLGRAIALELARRGAFVAINYRSREKDAVQTLAQIEAQGGRGSLHRADVADPAAVAAMFSAILRERGHVDVLVNCAGITRDEYFVTMQRESWRDVISTNLTGTFHCCKAVLRNMCAGRRGVIINIGSGSSISPRPGQVNYGASKSSLIGFTKSLAREVADHGVRVLLVAPGLLETDMTKVLPAEVAKESLKLIPLGRWGRPEEVAEIVGFVASDDASYITGQALLIDGGRMVVENEFHT
jgi:3-oxoacyl-[acyl-carrier protein] reductase